MKKAQSLLWFWLLAGSLSAAGRIVPVAAPGVEVAEVSGRPSARGATGPVAWMTSVTTGDGFLYLHLVLENRSPAMVEVGPRTVKLLSKDGSRPKPLPARQYVDLRFKAEPVQLDAMGKPVQAPQSPGTTPAERAGGKSMMEVFTQTDYADEEMQNRVEAAKEMEFLEKSQLTKNGLLEAGGRTLEKLVFQRNHVEVPFVVEITVGSGSSRVTFDREP